MKLLKAGEIYENGTRRLEILEFTGEMRGGMPGMIYRVRDGMVVVEHSAAYLWDTIFREGLRRK